MTADVPDPDALLAAIGRSYGLTPMTDADVPGSLPWTVAKVQEVAADEQPCGQCGHERWMHDERDGCGDGWVDTFGNFVGHDGCECVRFDGPQP